MKAEKVVTWPISVSVQIKTHQIILLHILDSTAQYIQGEVGNEVDGLVSEGLQCVAVLIGVYCKKTGLPLIGVTNQPFYKLDSSRYSIKTFIIFLCTCLIA